MSLATMQFARNILKNLRETYNGEPRTRMSADEKDFPHLDLAAYKRFRDKLEGSDFRLLGDYEITDVSRARGTPFTRTFIRYMISADGTTVCSYYQARQRTGKRLRMLFNELMDGRGKAAWDDFKQAIAIRPCIDIGTDFSDGRSLATSNVQAAGKLADPPTMETRTLPAETPIEMLLQAHAARVTEIRAQHPDASPVPVDSTEELFHLQDRAAVQKADYRKSLNWITRDELLAMASGNEAFADAVYEEIQKQLAEELEAQSDSGQ